MELKEQIVDLLSKSEPMRPGEIADSLKAERKDIDKAIKVLKNNEQIYSPKNCFYSVKK